MKNIHVLPTDKPSRLWLTKLGNLTRCHDIKPIKEALGNNVNIYITSSEEIKEGDWYCSPNGIVSKHNGTEKLPDNWNKIILTTDQDLIVDGVQAIDDEFLEWFVKNPSCEEVEALTDSYTMQEIFELKLRPDIFKYKIIIPREEQKQHLIDMMKADEELGLYEEPKTDYSFFIKQKEEEFRNFLKKQETLEEAAKRLYPHKLFVKVDATNKKRKAFIEGAKWQQERLCDSEVIQRIRATKSDAEARRIIRTI